MKNLITLSILLFAGMAYSQCPPGSVELTTQAEVDEFVATYPDCEVIDGNLTIGNPTLVAESPLDLSGLSNLTEVTGTLTLRRMDVFDQELDEIVPASLTGLEGITSVKSLIVSSVFAPIHFVSLDPLNNISGQVDSLFLENLILSNPLPPFENVEGVGYYLQDFVQGIESTPTFPSLTYLGDFTVTGQTSEFDTLQTVIIPSQLTEIGTTPDSFNWPFGGVFVFGTGGVTEILGGENLTNVQEVFISNNTSLNGIPAFNNVSAVDNDFIISSCQPEIFNSFGNLQFTETDQPIELQFALEGDCNEQIFESVEFGIGSLLPDNASPSYGLDIQADQVNSITVSGNFNTLESLALNSTMATEITGLSNLDSISGDLDIGMREISQLPEFTDLVYIGGDFEMRLNFGEWQLENMSGLESLEVVEGELKLGGGGPSGASQFTTLDGLEGLIDVGSLELRNLEALSDLSALAGLESAGEISLVNLDALTTPPSFDGLAEFDLISIDGTALPSMPLFPAALSIEGDIEVTDNANLTSLNGFDNLESLNGMITVEGNDALVNFDLPEDLEFDGELILNENPTLEDCGMSASLCNIISQASVFSINQNGDGCMTGGEVLETCLLSATNVTNKIEVTIGMGMEGIWLRSTSAIGPVVIEMVSMDGRRIFSEMRNLSSGEMRLAMPDLAEGIYVISLRGEEIYQTEKVFMR